MDPEKLTCDTAAALPWEWLLVLDIVIFGLTIPKTYAAIHTTPSERLAVTLFRDGAVSTNSHLLLPLTSVTGAVYYM